MGVGKIFLHSFRALHGLDAVFFQRFVRNQEQGTHGHSSFVTGDEEGGIAKTPGPLRAIAFAAAAKEMKDQKVIKALKDRFPGVRAAHCLTPEMAKMARSHNNANILVLSGKWVEKDGQEKYL